MKEETRKLCIDTLLLFAVAVVAYYFFDLFFFILFPVGLGLLFSQIIQKSFSRLHPLSNGVKKVLIVLILLIFFALISLCAVLIADRIIHLFSHLSAYLTEHASEYVHSIQSTIERAESFFSDLFHRDLKNSVSQNLPQIVRQVLQEIVTKIPSWVAKIASSVPGFILSLFIFLLCSYYFSCDWERLSNFFKKKIRGDRMEKLLIFKKRFFIAAKQWSRAYFLLFLLTFAQLFFGFSLLKITAAGGKALLVAFVDLLPVLGCGTILIPWSLFSFFTGNHTLGLGLLVLYLVIFVIRQIAEPKIVGSSIGIHPVLSLVLVLTGLKFFGFPGMILLPLIATCLLEENA